LSGIVDQHADALGSGTCRFGGHKVWVGSGARSDCSQRQRRVADEVADCAGRDAADAIRTAAIAAERELVEIGLQVARLDGTGVRAKQRALVLRHRSVDRLQAIFDAALGRYLYDHRMVTIPKARFVVARMAIAGNSGLGGHAGVGKSLQCLRAICARVGESHTSVGFGGDNHHGLSRACAAHESFIDFNVLVQRSAVRCDQRRADLVQPGPGGFIGLEAHDPLQILARDAVAARRDFKDRAKPDLERFLRFSSSVPDVRLA
jgi:hypothetical protein